MRQWNRVAFGTRALWVAAAVLAATWNLGIMVALSLQEEPDRTTRANQEIDGGASELRKSTLRDQAARMEGDLAAMRHNVEQQTATAMRTVDEASPAKQPANAGLAELQKSLQLERDRASKLEQDLATARRNVEPQTTLAAKAGAEASKLKVDASLQQERNRASKLEQDLATARRDVETQNALAAKAGAEASQLKKTADASTADLRKSLQQEQDRASKLEQDLTTARRDVETQTALAAKAGAETSEFKKTADGSADLRKSLQQEHERTSKLEQDLATARRDVETQTALAAKAGEEASQLKKTADGSADLRKSLQQEHERASKLEQDLTIARRDVGTQMALAVKASEEKAQLKQAVEKGSAEQRQSLQQERDKAEALAQELSMARAQIYAYEAQARQASDQAADSSAAELRKSLQQERDRASKLEQDLAAARRDVETQTALAEKAGAEASQLKKKSLQQERDRASRLEQDLAATQRDIKTLATLAAKASAEAARLKAAESGSAELRQSLQEEHERVMQLERDLALARSKENAPAPVVTAAQSKAEPTRPVLAEQAIVAGARPDAPFIIDEGDQQLNRAIASSAGWDFKHSGFGAIVVNDRPDGETLNKRSARDIVRELLDRDAGLDEAHVRVAQHQPFEGNLPRLAERDFLNGLCNYSLSATGDREPSLGLLTRHEARRCPLPLRTAPLETELPNRTCASSSHLVEQFLRPPSRSSRASR
jgi:hypothetical protein